MNQNATSNRLEIFSEPEWQQLIKELSLSPKEGQILHCLFEGDSDKQTAKELRIGVPTVRTHLGRLFRKLGVSDREELILRVFSHFRGGCRKIKCPRN